jgi:hypothetical protein
MLELIELSLGFRDATPEALYVVFQAVAFIIQFTKAGGQPVDSPRPFPQRSGYRRALPDVLAIAAETGH